GGFRGAFARCGAPLFGRQRFGKGLAMQTVDDAVLPNGIGLAGKRAGVFSVDARARLLGMANSIVCIASGPAQPVGNQLSQEFPDRAHLTLLYALPGATLEGPVWFHQEAS